MPLNAGPTNIEIIFQEVVIAFSLQCKISAVLWQQQMRHWRCTCKITKYKFPIHSSYYILDNRAKIWGYTWQSSHTWKLWKKGDTEMLIYLEFLLTHHTELGKRDTDNFFSHVLVISDCITYTPQRLKLFICGRRE